MEFLLTPNNINVFARRPNGKTPIKDGNKFGFDGDDPIEFEDADSTLLFFFPKDYAYAAADSVTDFLNRTSLRRYIYSDRGKDYMLVGVPWTWIDSAPKGDLIIDPTTSVTPNTDVRLMDGGLYGGGASLSIAKNSGVSKSRSLLSFNVTAVPPNATVLNAQMKLYYYTAVGSAWVDRWVQAHEVYVSWSEAQANRDNRRTAVPWKVQYGKIGGGSDSLTTDANGQHESKMFFQSGQTNTWKSWDLTQLAQKWVIDPATNFGALLWATNEDSNAMTLWFRSSEYSNSALWPVLEVVYSTAPKTVYFLKDHLGSIRATVLDSATAPVIGYDDYDPWGYPLALRTKAIPNAYLQGASKNKFTGKERDDELGLNLDYFGARYYDPLIGRFISVDRFALKYPSMTPFQYAANNPTLYIDVNGDTVAVFDHKTGNFLNFEDDGRKEWSGVTRTTRKNGKTKNVTSFSFNDPGVDIQAIRNGVITRVEFVSDERLQVQMARSGVDKNEGIGYAKEHSVAAGKMDYAVQGRDAGDLNKNTFYVRENAAYNIADFGNYLWGRGMSMLGNSLGTALLGAQYNNFLNGYLGKTDQTELFNFGPGTYGPSSIFDSIADQRAIMKGHESHYRYNRPLEAHP